MSRIRARDTGPERQMAELLSAVSLSYETHARDLPGRPDFVFRNKQVAIFVDGDFWHGWRFPAWRLNLSEAWEEKIARTRKRDARNHARLRRQGWKVVRVWEHQLERDPAKCLLRVRAALQGELGAKTASDLLSKHDSKIQGRIRQ